MTRGLRVPYWLFVLELAAQATCLASSDARLLVDFAERSQIDPAVPTQVFRIDLDVTGDGIPELFLANAALAGTSGVEGWFVYAQVGDGQYRFIDALEFSHLLFRVSENGSRIWAHYKDDIGRGTIVAYHVEETGFTEESRSEGVAVGSDPWREFGDWRNDVGLEVLAADFSALFSNPNAVWMDVLSNEPASGAVPPIDDAVVVE